MFPIRPALIAAGALLFAAGAFAADVRLNRDVDSYEGKDPARREAWAARDEARRGILGKDDEPAEFERNRLARCDVHKGFDRELCLRRMRGEGTVSGSVEDGGILRELRVTVPADR